MQITKVEGYALRAALDMALVSPSSVKAIAQRQHIPVAYLSKIVQSLARAGVVLTSRGVGGGVQLARPPELITLRQVIEAVQGPIVFSRCLAEPMHDCAINGPSCPVRRVTTRLHDLVINELERTTVSDMAHMARSSPQEAIEASLFTI
jgi:Rrf2 family protein